jgi:hypothetical protein
MEQSVNTLWSFVFFVVVSLLVAACGGPDSAGPDPGGVQTEVSAIARYVDPIKGIDGDGRGTTPEKAFRTISFALRQVGSLEIVLANGNYTVETGESFPLTVGSDKWLTAQSFDPEGGGYPAIQGCGTTDKASLPAAIVILGAGQVENVNVSCPSGIAIIAKNDVSNNVGFFINNSIIGNSAVGIFADALGQISKNYIFANRADGVLVARGANLYMNGNVIEKNDVGLTLERGAQVMFLNLAGTTNMILRGNGLCDLRYRGDGDLLLYGTTWDNESFAISRTCSDGANVAIEGTGGVQYGLRPDTDSTAFPGTMRMVLYEPIGAQVVGTTMPMLKWSPNGSALAATAIFSAVPVIGSKGIENTSDIVWYWHSGLGGGRSGVLSYAQGRKTPPGFGGASDQALPLNPGSIYYWVAWEWDVESGKVIASSNIAVFRTAP